GDIIQTSGVLLGVDGFTRFRTNALIGYPDYTLLPNSPLRRAAVPNAYASEMTDLGGKPVTSDTGAPYTGGSYSSYLALGSFQYDSLPVIQGPLRAALALQGAGIVLSW